MPIRLAFGFMLNCSGFTPQILPTVIRAHCAGTGLSPRLRTGESPQTASNAKANLNQSGWHSLTGDTLIGKVPIRTSCQCDCHCDCKSGCHLKVTHPLAVLTVSRRGQVRMIPGLSAEIHPAGTRRQAAWHSDWRHPTAYSLSRAREAGTDAVVLR